MAIARARVHTGGCGKSTGIHKPIAAASRIANAVVLIAALVGCGVGSVAGAADSPGNVSALEWHGSGNTAPTVTGTPATNVTAGERYSFKPNATDGDGDALVFGVMNRPTWVTFNTATGSLFGVPHNANAGMYRRIVISVSDGVASRVLPAFVITVVPGSTDTPPQNGNFDPAFVPSAADYLYVDLNSVVNGTGSSPTDPTNRLPAEVGDGRQLLFNSDNGVQTIPCQNDAIYVTGRNIQISSYGSARATVSGYQIFDRGWTQVGASDVWQRYFSGGTSGAGPVVGNMVDLSSTRESPTGDVLNWQNLEAVGDKIGAFRGDPTVLPVGAYGYDWEQRVMYVNVGANPNGRRLGISCVGYFINTLSAASPSRVTMHKLRLIGFARDGVNIIGSASYWHIYDNDLYANGGMYNVNSRWYFGSGIQMSEHANHVEIDHNRIVQTFDSPITPQHFGGSTGGYLHDLYFHDNFIDRWALAAVEMSDFGTNNQFSNIIIEGNVAINGGRGFSRTGDTPQGYTDGIQVRGGNRSTFSNLIIRHNKINAYNSNIRISGSNFINAVPVVGNTLSGASYGIINQRPDSASIDGTENTLCGNTVQVYDKAPGSQYSSNKLVAVICAIH